MKKELVTLELRYKAIQPSDGTVSSKIKRITIGIYDDIDAAVDAANNALNTISYKFEIRDDDNFKASSLGQQRRLVTNCCYPTDGVEYFLTISQLDFGDIMTGIQDAIDASVRANNILKVNKNKK